MERDHKSSKNSSKTSQNSEHFRQQNVVTEIMNKGTQCGYEDEHYQTAQFESMRNEIDNLNTMNLQLNNKLEEVMKEQKEMQSNLVASENENQSLKEKIQEIIEEKRENNRVLDCQLQLTDSFRALYEVTKSEYGNLHQQIQTLQERLKEEASRHSNEILLLKQQIEDENLKVQRLQAIIDSNSSIQNQECNSSRCIKKCPKLTQNQNTKKLKCPGSLLNDMRVINQQSILKDRMDNLPLSLVVKKANLYPPTINISILRKRRNFNRLRNKLQKSLVLPGCIGQNVSPPIIKNNNGILDSLFNCTETNPVTCTCNNTNSNNVTNFDKNDNAIESDNLLAFTELPGIPEETPSLIDIFAANTDLSGVQKQDTSGCECTNIKLNPTKPRQIEIDDEYEDAIDCLQ